MVSATNLALINYRLEEIFYEYNSPFSGQNIVLFGDLLQVNIL